MSHAHQQPTPEVTSVMQPGSLECLLGGASDCVCSASGHRLTVMRERVARATPSRWHDGVVTSIDAAGWAMIDLVWAVGVDDSRSTDAAWARSGHVRVWNHSDLAAALAVGEPVSVHENYDVLAIGESRLSVIIEA